MCYFFIELLYNDTSSLHRFTYFQGQVVGSYTGYRTCNVTLLVCPLRHFEN